MLAVSALVVASAVSAVCSFAGKKNTRLEPYAFYEACRSYYEETVSRNWKDREKALEKIRKDVDEYGEPIVRWQLSRDRLLEKQPLGEFLEAWKSGLQAAENSMFYKLNASYPDFIMGGVSNDYEYVLWDAMGHYYWTADARAAFELLKSHYAGQYPFAPYLEYYGIRIRNGMSGPMRYSNVPEEQKAALEGFAERYSGRAIGLLAERDLLTARMDSIRTSDGARAFRKECADFERKRSSYRGEEKKVAESCTGIAGIIDELDSRQILQSCSGDTVFVAVRNLDGVDVELWKSPERGMKDAGPIVQTRLTNDVKSYYVYDTLCFILPPVDDGDYTVVCRNGKNVSEGSFTRNSVSVAYRGNGEYWLYAAESRSGRPVQEADITISYKGEVQKTVRGFALDGFTRLPEEVEELIKANDGVTILSCSYTDGSGLLRKSKDVHLWKRTADAGDVNDVADAGIFLDRAAYNPGDTVRFKVLLYRRDRNSMSVMPEGMTVSVSFMDNDGRTVAAQELGTNEFGSAAGKFVLPKDMERNGRYSLCAGYEGRRLCTASFTVDEFVLPTYTVRFEDDNIYHIPGDTVRVRGQVKSLTGHPLSSASLTYSVSYGDFMQSGSLDVGADGSFEVVFRSRDEDSADYRVNVRAVDLTGETAEASRYVRVYSRLYLNGEVEDEAEGSVRLVSGDGYNVGSSIMKGDVARIRFVVDGTGVRNVPKEIGYRVLSGKEQLYSGESVSGEYVTVDLTGRPAGVYRIEAESSYTLRDGTVKKISYARNLVRVSVSDSALYSAGVRNMFRKVDGERIGALVGTTDGPLWAVAELYDDKGNVLESGMIYLEGQAGRPGSLQLVDYEYKDWYSDAVAFRVFYFKDEERFEYYTEFMRPRPSCSLPLEYVSFMDRSVPGALTEFRLRTLPGVEALVSVYDRSTESIRKNVWNEVHMARPYVSGTYIWAYAGGTSFWTDYVNLESDGITSVAYGTSTKSLMAGASPLYRSNADMKKAAAAESEESAEDSLEDGAADLGADVPVRDDFRNTIAFLPFLRSDKDGYIDFSVVPSGKLSTYYVSLFAHDKGMRNGVLKREMTVTLPVKVSVMEPGFLYSGDRYRLKASVSNISEKPIEGMLTLYVYDSRDYRDSEPIAVRSSRVAAFSGQACAEEFEVKVPSGIDVLGFKVVFAGMTDGVRVSDGVFVDVPVKPACQVLSETHSAVLYGEDGKDALVDSLRKAFVNVTSMGAEYNEISLRDMLMESLPGKVEVKGDDVLSCSESYYANWLLDGTGHVQVDWEMMKELEKKVAGCQNADGGFGWFAGMKSSAYITAVILERARRTGSLLDEGQVEKAVRYLDGRQFAEDYDWSRLSLGQYLNVRSMYAEVPFDIVLDKQKMAQFRTDAKEWLKPAADGDGRHDILARARRIAVKMNLAGPGAGSLLKTWKLGSARSLLLSAGKELDVLEGYAVKHPSGGYYFPNAVMPFRGLLESELYAHVMLCRIFEAAAGNPALKYDAGRAVAIADGLRVWMMVQKETQRWDSEPAYIDAVLCVLGGSDKVLDTKVLTLTKRYQKPFRDINASGNGFRISRRYYKVAPDGKLPSGGYREQDALKEGDVLNAGDRIVAVYDVWSQENRSFVRITAPRYASLRPVQQLSGIIGWTYRPVTFSGKYMIYPQGYRNVRTDRTELYFDVLPEEGTSFTEEFLVTQAGTFTSPVVTVESLYAPHYRANDVYGGVMRSE